MDQRLKTALENFDLEAYVRQVFDMVIEGSAGVELRINCFSPQGCNGEDDKQHLWINPEKKAWICYKCGYGDHRQQPGTGFIPRFIADIEGKTVQEVCRGLEEKSQPTPDGDLEELLLEMFAESAVEVVPDRIDLPGAFITCPLTIGYLRSRGIDPDDIRKYDLRYSGSTRLKLWRNRLVFPIRDQFGVVRSAVGRHVLGREPRWVNWPKTDVQQLLWPLGEWAHGKWIQNRPDWVVLTEGILDALGIIKLTTWGCTGLATFGHKLSERQVEVLQDLDVQEVMLAWDWDARKVMAQAVDRLVGRFKRVSVFPFLDARWVKADLGDTLVDSSLAGAMCHEVDNRIDVESSEFLKWKISINLE